MDKALNNKYPWIKHIESSDTFDANNFNFEAFRLDRNNPNVTVVDIFNRPSKDTSWSAQQKGKIVIAVQLFEQGKSMYIFCWV